MAQHHILNTKLEPMPLFLDPTPGGNKSFARGIPGLIYICKNAPLSSSLAVV